MAVAGAPAARAGPPHSLDLKRSLMLRVVAVAVICFVAAAALALYGTHRQLRQANETVADLIVRQLQLQLWRIETGIDVPARFPDWDPVIDRIQGAGQCIRYVRSDGSLGRSGCVGAPRNKRALPAWASTLGGAVLGRRTETADSVSYRGKTYGTVVVTTDAGVVMAAVWNDVSGLLGLTALLVGTICLLQYVAISRALRPAKDILLGLDRLARGDLSCRLPGFHLAELRRIAEVFNTLAASLDRTTRERTQLAARLVDGQEQERRNLARELHDELAQTLSAMSATAASIRATAEAQCPALAPEASRLAETAVAALRSLRATLQTLRPPEIEDFGLAASLEMLAREQERRAGGRLKVALEIEGSLKALPPTAAGHVYRIVQEGLTNAAKHAGACRARVAIEVRPELPGAADERRRHWLALTIEDDGWGAAGDGAAGAGGGLGLMGMRERAMALGGQLDAAALDQGFKVRAVIPFAAAEALS